MCKKKSGGKIYEELFGSCVQKEFVFGARLCVCESVQLEFRLDGKGDQKKGSNRVEKEKKCPIVGKVVHLVAWVLGAIDSHTVDSQPQNGAKNTDLLISAQVAMERRRIKSKVE